MIKQENDQYTREKVINENWLWDDPDVNINTQIFFLVGCVGSSLLRTGFL